MAVHGRWEVPDSGGGGREIKLEEHQGGFFAVWMTLFKQPGRITRFQEIKLWVDFDDPFHSHSLIHSSNAL